MKIVSRVLGGILLSLVVTSADATIIFNATPSGTGNNVQFNDQPPDQMGTTISRARLLFRKTLHADVGALLGLMPRPIRGEPVGKIMAAFAVQVDEEIRDTVDGCERVENHDPLDKKGGRVIDIAR
jgi:hypothetical protein